MKSLKIFSLVVIVIIVIIGLILVLDIRITTSKEHISNSTIEEIKSLGYLDWHTVKREDIDKVGVVKYHKDLSYNGLNIFNYDGLPIAYLMTMTGKILHTWSYGDKGWHYVEMLENEDLLCIVKDSMLLKLNWDSKPQWMSKGRYHHDVSVAENGDIYAITRTSENIPYKSNTIPILNDYITLLSPEGETKKTISIFDLFGQEIPESRKREIFIYFNKAVKEEKTKKRKPGGNISDVFHTNTIEWIKKDIKGLAKKGNLLICIRNLNIIAILDVEKEKIVWRLNRNDLDMPHQPSLNNDGNILIFDNGFYRKYSRIMVIDPFTAQILREYKGDPEKSFFSPIRGGCQELPNRNLLITESNKSHVFEVDLDGNIVWEYYGLEVDKKVNKRRPIYRMTRIGMDFLNHMKLKNKF